MTQEILDCLLIKKQFVLMNSSQILDVMNTDEDTEIYIDLIYKIIKSDNFFYTMPSFIEKLSTIVYEKRFSGNYNKETIYKFNEIIDVVNTYKLFDETDKIFVNLNWINKQSKKRCLHYRKIFGYTLEDMYQHIINDFKYASMLVHQDSVIEIDEPFQLLGTISMLITEYPLLFEDVDTLTRCYYILMLLADKKCTYHKKAYFRMVNEVSLKLIDLNKQINQDKVKTYVFS